jgi:hypothetical protein
MFKLYLFSYIGDNKEFVINHIKNVINFWYKFDSHSFIICSDLNIDDLHDKINENFGKDYKFLLLEIDIKKFKIRLDTDTYNWLINKIDKTK